MRFVNKNDVLFVQGVAHQVVESIRVNHHAETMKDFPYVLNFALYSFLDYNLTY